MRPRPLFIVSTACAFALLAACEIHTGDGAQPATPAATTATPAVTPAPTTTAPTPPEQHLATGHILIDTSNDAGT
ncbi:MAG: hypothetical protein ABI551_07980 [Polyangiaceae bacterium]